MADRCIFATREDEGYRRDCHHAEEVKASNYQICIPCSIFYLTIAIKKKSRIHKGI